MMMMRWQQMLCAMMWNNNKSLIERERDSFMKYEMRWEFCDDNIVLACTLWLMIWYAQCCDDVEMEIFLMRDDTVQDISSWPCDNKNYIWLLDIKQRVAILKFILNEDTDGFKNNLVFLNTMAKVLGKNLKNLDMPIDVFMVGMGLVLKVFHFISIKFISDSKSRLPMQ